MATKTLYVGNLPYDVTEGDLREHFSKYNSTKVRIIEGRGFGFVDIDADQLASAIVDTDKKDLKGRNHTVNEAQPKNNDGGNRSGGYGGGSRSNRDW